jgi:hypothetical protein
MKIKALLLFSCIILVTACAVHLPMATQPDVDRGKALYPGYDMSQLEAGQKIYTEKCGRCHRLKRPDRITPATWTKVLPNMLKKAKLNPTDAGLVEKYIRVMQGWKKK